MSEIIKTKRFFRLDDGAAYYLVIAHDVEHAGQILTDAGIEFGYPSATFDKAVDETGDPLKFVELSNERVERIRVDMSEQNTELGKVPVSDCEVGDWFCSEY